MRPTRALRGVVQVPGDKSVTHRALLLAAIAEGESRLRGLLEAGDCLATLRAVEALGVEVQRGGAAGAALGAGEVRLRGRWLEGLRAPRGPIDCGRSATTLRLLAGLLAGRPERAVLTGDPQLVGRPMARVVEPLRRMGARIEAEGGRAPLTLAGVDAAARGLDEHAPGPPDPSGAPLEPTAPRAHALRGGSFDLSVSSAQVKSALLLAGLRADGHTSVTTPAPCRDHTERLLLRMGAPLRVVDLTVTVRAPERPLAPLDVTVPGDLSSAAVLLAAASLVPEGEVRVEGAGLNPTRTGFLSALWRMGGALRVEDERERSGEPLGTVVAGPAALRATRIGGAEVPALIDELPLLVVLATQAEGATVIRDAAELRAKESDRIATLARELRRLGAVLDEAPDGVTVHGPTPLRGAEVDGHGDHRIVMALALAGLVAQGVTVVRGAEALADSYPGLIDDLRRLGAELELQGDAPGPASGPGDAAGGR